MTHDGTGHARASDAATDGAYGALRRVLIVKMSALGDVVRALPVASALRRRFPSMHLTWAVEERFAPLLRRHRGVDRVVAFPRLDWGAVDRAWPAALRRALREVRADTYDLALDLQGLFKSSVIALSSAAPIRVGLQPQREGAWLVSRAIPVRRRHEVDRFVDCAVHLGAAAEPVDFGLSVEPSAAAAVKRRLHACGVTPSEPLIVINPTATGGWRDWPEEHWVRVASALAASGRIVLIGMALYRARHHALTARLRSGAIDLTGETDLSQLVALLARCALHLGPDTGTVHLAAALGRPVVSVYGPTSPWRASPYGQLDRVVYRAGACGLECPRWCTRRRRCLRDISPDEVVARAHAALANSVVRSQPSGAEAVAHRRRAESHG